MVESSSCALVFIGESFRFGSQYSRNRGTNEAYIEQIQASQSHQELIAFIDRKWGYKTHVYLHTYSTNYDAELLKIYKPTDAIFLKNTPYISCIDDHVQLSTNAFSLSNVTKDYKFIWFIRIDLLLKDAMFDKLEALGPGAFEERIMYPSMCLIGFHKSRYWPRVNDTMMSVPSRYFDLLEMGVLRMNHDSWASVASVFPRVKMGFILKTLHDSDTEKDWNPVYKIVNRKESTLWISFGWQFNDEICDAVYDALRPF
jgi:hypothetical protein